MNLGGDGGDVDVGDESRDFGSGLEELRVPHEKGDADGFVEGPAFVAEAVFTPEVAVVGREDEDGVVELLCFFERGEELADAFVNRDDAAELIADEFVLAGLSLRSSAALGAILMGSVLKRSLWRSAGVKGPWMALWPR